MARCSQSCACFCSSSACFFSFAASAMATATSCLAFASWPRMSSMTWISIFSGFSARAIRSLMFDLSMVEKRSKIPIGSDPSLGSGRGGGAVAVVRERVEVRRERHLERVEGRLELVEVEVLGLQRLGEDHVALLQPVGGVHQVGGVQLQQPPE